LSARLDQSERVVISGIGMIASVGDDRESVWRAVRQGKSAVRRLSGVPGIPDGKWLGATVDLERHIPGQLKVIPLCRRAAQEAIGDAGLRWDRVDPDRFGCAISGHIGDTDFIVEQLGRDDLMTPGKPPWWTQWLPNSACSLIANEIGAFGPRLCHSTACASGLIDILAAVRAIQDGQCDVALAGSAEAIHPLFAAGFEKMKVLAHHVDPRQACRPFDAARRGFVMGEGAAMFVLERLSHAQRRGAAIYAEIVAGKVMCDAHHVTGLDAESEVLSRLISATLRHARLKPGDIGYINAHGTGTRMNDVMESRGIRKAMGKAADKLCVSSTKSMLGHLVNASGSVELAVTALALRDGFAPPTMNLTHPDPECDLDCVPLVGRARALNYAMKLSVAFGGHIAAIALRRWDRAEEVRRAA
jgi:3-oxoacyl-(acyl-carrier-protein) synthase